MKYETGCQLLFLADSKTVGSKPTSCNRYYLYSYLVHTFCVYICSIKIGYRTAEPCMKFLLFNLVNKDKETEEWIQNFSALCVYIFWIKYLLIQGKLNDILFSKPFYIWKFGFIYFLEPIQFSL